uniref:Uncharacterized protein n=1 Tax=Trichogramma kaykai TaxID=54128 RepID=A0ABD2X5Y5_9HYME
MESRKDTVRVKEESKDFWPDTADDYNVDSAKTCEVKSIQSFPFNKSSVSYTNKDLALQEKLTTTICKSEYENNRPTLILRETQRVNVTSRKNP